MAAVSSLWFDGTACRWFDDDHSRDLEHQAARHHTGSGADLQTEDSPRGHTDELI